MKTAAILIVGAFFLCCMQVSNSFGQGYEGCTNYEDYLHWTGRIAWGHSAEDVSVQGTYAYLVDNLYLKTIDISDVNHPIEVNSQFIFDGAGVCTSEGLLFVVGEENFRIFSLDVPESPSLLSTLGVSCTSSAQ